MNEELTKIMNDELTKFTNELMLLCIKHHVKITSVCDTKVGVPFACFYQNGDKSKCVDIDFDNKGYFIGQTLELK